MAIGPIGAHGQDAEDVKNFHKGREAAHNLVRQMEALHVLGHQKTGKSVPGRDAKPLKVSKFVTPGIGSGTLNQKNHELR